MSHQDKWKSVNMYVTHVSGQHLAAVGKRHLEGPRSDSFVNYGGAIHYKNLGGPGVSYSIVCCDAKCCPCNFI
jgi:hypothetical protein